MDAFYDCFNFSIYRIVWYGCVNTDTFSALGQGSGGASLSVIAPAISEALVATAAGIFVAIPAYSAHLFLKRQAYDVMVYIQREVDYLIANKENVDV